MVLSMERWVNKLAIVTGASSGIGAAIVDKLVEEGMVVVGLARRIDRMEEASRKLVNRKGSFHPIKCDISVESEILEAFKYVKDNLGTIHVLINNAGIARLSRLVDGDTEDWRKVLEVNILGLCIATREAIKDMRNNQVDGHIIHMNSILGHSVPSKFQLNLYSPSKYAVTSLSECLRHEFNTIGSKIRITSLSPGIVKTEIFEASGIPYEAVRDMVGTLPYIEPEDVADSVVYILSTPPNVQVSELTIRPVNEIL